MPIASQESVGASLTDRDEAEIKSFAGLAQQVAERRKSIEAYVERSVRELAPNVYELAGPLIAARLVTLAGGGEGIARAPTGTVPLHGAVRALVQVPLSGNAHPYPQV